MSLDQRFFIPDTGDTVYCPEADEEWIVAHVEYDMLSWCGWPEGRIEVSRVRLREKATADDKRREREAWAAVPGNDHRAIYARRMLENQ